MIAKVTKNSQQNNSDTVKSENEKEVPKEIRKEGYISAEERHIIIDNLRLL